MCYLAAQLSRRFSRSNLRSLSECPHYIAISILTGFGGLSSQRLCSSAAAIGLFAATALLKKALVSEKKEFPRRSTRYVSQGTEVTLVTEYVCISGINRIFKQFF